MEPKKKRSTGLLIRRFLAGYIFLSVVAQLIDDISKGEFSNKSLDDLFFGLLIVFFLAFYSRKKKVVKEPDEEIDQPTVNANYENTEDIDMLVQKDVQNGDEDIEIENLKTQIEEVEIKTKNVNKPSGYNPVKDNEGIFSRIFKGRINRYG